MKKSWLAVAVALAFSAHTQLAFAQITSNSSGGAGGQGGAAQGGTATGGAATNSNTVTSSGGSGGGGGLGGTGGTSSAQGGTATAQGGTATGIQTGPINGTGNNQAAEVTVNYITPAAPGGIKGLAAGVDPENNHFVTDNNVHYSGTTKVKNTPDISVGGPASGPCNGFSGGLGVSVPGFAIGANASTVDKGCEARETARIAAMLGRMDLANAVLEHISVVEEALKAKAARETAAKQAAATVAPARAAPAAQPGPSDAEMETARLLEQKRLAVAAIQRSATMNKLNDNLTFTNAATQGNEKTPQQIMAEEASKQQAEEAARLAKQQQVEQQQLASKSATADKPLNSRAPELPAQNLTVANAAAAPAAPAAPQQSRAPATAATIQAPERKAAASVETAPVANQAQPRVVSVDKVTDVLGFSAAVKASISGTSSPSAADDAPQKAASNAAVVQQAATSGAAPNKMAGAIGSKSPAPTADPVSVAKVLLNLR